MSQQPSPANDPEHLLVHDAFVRGLARQLVRDPEQAADLAQQTWLAALRRPPAGTEVPTVRAFLAAIVRRLVDSGERGVTIALFALVLALVVQMVRKAVDQRSTATS